MRLNPFLPRSGGRDFHYAWVVLFSGMVITATSSGVRQSFGVFIDPLVEAYGWSRGSISLAYSLVFLAAVPLSLVAGTMADRFGARRLVLAAGVFFTAGMLLTGTMTQRWQFYLYYGVFLGGMGSTVFNVTLPVLVTRWYSKRMGLALGLMWTAVGIGPIFFPPLFRWLIETAGWRQAFSLIGAGGGGLIFLAAFFLRSRPEDVGLRAYGEAPVAAATQAAPVVGVQQVMATSAFKYLVAIHLLGCAGHSLPLAHMVSMATFVGVPGLMAAGLLSAASAGSIASRFGIPILTERLGGRSVLTLAFTLQSAPILLLLVAREPWAFYSFAVLFGMGYGGEMTGYPIINRQYYGANAPLNTIYSRQMAGAWIGMALGGYLGGVLFDLTGAYTLAILAAAGFGFLGLLPILLLPAHRPGCIICFPTPQPATHSKVSEKVWETFFSKKVSHRRAKRSPRRQ